MNSLSVYVVSGQHHPSTGLRGFLSRALLAVALTLASGTLLAATLEVHKSPTCGCCNDWIDHMRANGFTVNAHNDGNERVRAQAGIPAQLGSCHTALVEGYVIEGHVPADDVKRLLKERPQNAIGLTAPGMPHGSPGMETGRVDAYDVLLVKDAGNGRKTTEVYSSYGPGQAGSSSAGSSTIQSLMRRK